MTAEKKQPKLRLNLMRQALARGSAPWPEIKRVLQPLTVAELAELESVELLSRRRENLLRAIRSERGRRRSGRAKGPQCAMKVISKL